MVEAGAVRRIVKQIYKDGTEPDAIAILLELSERETLAEKIGSTKDCIPLLVSLLSNSNPDVSQNAHNVLQNLSSNTHFVVKMAEAGHFQPFVTRFNQGISHAHMIHYLMASQTITCVTFCRASRDQNIDGCSIDTDATQGHQHSGLKGQAIHT